MVAQPPTTHGQSTPPTKPQSKQPPSQAVTVIGIPKANEAPQAAVLAHGLCFSMRRVMPVKTLGIQTATCFMPPH